MLPLIFGVQEDTRYSKLFQLKSPSWAETCSDAKMSTVCNWRPPWEPWALWSHNLGMIRPRHKSSPSLYLAFPFSSIIFWLLDFFSTLESGRLDPIKSSISLFPRVISGPDIPVAPCRLSSYNFESKSPPSPLLIIQLLKIGLLYEPRSQDKGDHS